MSAFENVKYNQDDEGNTIGISYTINGKMGSAPISHPYYQEIMELVEAGELTIEPADEPPTEGD